MSYRSLVRNEFSDYNLLAINWLLQLNYLLVPVIVLWGIALLRVAIVTDYSSDFDLPIFGLIALFLFYLSYQAYTRPNMFERLPESVLKKREGDSGVSSTDDQLLKEDSIEIERLMIDDMYYLNHDLTIEAFSKEIGMSPRKVSKCINQNLGVNFNEWVNDFRVKRAQELLKEDTGNKYSIEGIGLEAGFKSRSALYSAFKNKLGRSPGEFRAKKDS